MARISHYYNISWMDVRALPMRTFWSLLKNMDKLIAEEELRVFMVTRQAFGGDEKSIKEFIEEREQRINPDRSPDDVLGVSKKVNSAAAIGELMSALS